MRLLFLALILALQVTQTPPERYPGQGNHEQPPAGWMCEPQNYTLTVPPDHACNCERMCDDSGQIREDRNCAVYCHMDHCKCEISNKAACHGTP